MPSDTESRTFVDRIQSRLERLATAVDQLPTIADSPETVLEIIGEARTEAYWEAFFVHFLDSRASHGFGTDVLEAVLRAISNQTDDAVTPLAHQLSDVQIASQVGADDGVPDVLLWLPDEWFCCLELKAHSQESNDQTTRYANSATLGPIHVDDYPPAARQYLYVAPASTPAPASATFTSVAWETIVLATRDVLATARGRYPSKS